MPRRLVLFTSLVLALVFAAAALALASGSDHGATTPAATPAATGPATPMGHRHRGGHRGAGGPMVAMVRRVVLTSLAGRLHVTPAALEDAIHAVAKDEFAAVAERAGLTSAETDALQACHAARHAGMGRARGAEPRSAASRAARRRTRAAACDRAVIRPALRKLRALPEPDLAALKTELAGALATKLGVPSGTVVTAVRAELEQRLGQAVTLGFLTGAGRTQALACFDAPAGCDLRALRKQVRGPFRRFVRVHGGRHGHHAHRAHAGRRR